MSLYILEKISLQLEKAIVLKDLPFQHVIQTHTKLANFVWLIKFMNCHCVVIFSMINKVQNLYFLLASDSFSWAGTKQCARVLILLGDLLHPSILTNIAESKVVKILSWTLDVQWWWLLCACARFEWAKTGNKQPPDWLRQKVCISMRNVSISTVILQNIF